ncbi:ABC transporter permease [Sulfitobacter sp. M57]|uniref:ABC transporter permease n=1 Tax=unclassified Sulfitobacter TaxID=196795 RepID=UPI0023E1F13F|nr:MULTISPECIES: ABC transporter permease [unclassified Sulfitobacter]MDF3416034.1 ABC transporter permease [Sulfitobacter sp. KE5]MDF3423514.1 ABC transporter permease [Sulfitobacter sp. KE43]MDF3434685.1 ABC transporter permease [Sulfitobacter sp. KE42]MDF3460220.1 ABC transporter permease [Sulfitobacter sp. S74]MDF3464222.1 ABC transporter permease [Sulfitobacter sp. Ks18]
MTVFRNILIRLLTTAVTLFGVAVIVFVVIRVVPGNPIAMMLPPGATDADIARLQAQYGFDKSIFQQFMIWLSGVMQGDFGTSISTRQPVAGLVLSRLPATLELSIVALTIAMLLGGALALAGTRFRETKAEAAVDITSGMALSIPDFLWGLVLILLFGVLWPVFHISGRISPALNIDFSTNFYLFESILRLRFDVIADLVGHMFMPALALAIPLAAIIAQLLKQSLKETMHLDYVTLARTKGYGENHVITREALPNAVLPTLTLVGVQFTFLIGGTVIIERLFSYEGLGNMAIDAVINRDLPLIQGIVILFAFLFTIVNLVVDMLYVLLNPKLRHA